MNDAGMLKPALIGGVLLGILSIIPGIQLCCCAWMIGGGILAAALYVKSSTTAVKLGIGMLLGLFTGAVGGLVYILFSIPIAILFSGGTGIFEESRRSLSSLPNLPPAFQEALANMPTSGSAMIVLLVFSSLLLLVLFSLVASVGGLIGVAIFEKRKIEGSVTTNPHGIEPPIPPPPPADGEEQ